MNLLKTIILLILVSTLLNQANARPPMADNHPGMIIILPAPSLPKPDPITPTCTPKECSA